jgi:ceramide glucosyltransferase
VTSFSWIVGLALLYLLLLGKKSGLARQVARNEPRLPPSDGAGVAIAQPILSGDPRLAEVLADNLRELPAARFLWLVDLDDAEAQRVCNDLATGHPEMKIEISLHAQPPDGKNPKLWKLEQSRAAHPAHPESTAEPVFLVLDDDTRMPGPTLAALLSALESHSVATSLPGYLDDGRWPSRLLAQFVDNNAALTYLPLLPFLPPLTINGMAYALQRKKLDEMGGFSPLLCHLTDDLAVAETVLAAGGTIFQTARPHWVETTVRDGKHYRQLMHRWFLFALLLLRKQPLQIRATIGLLHALPPLLLLGLVVTSAIAPSPAGLAVLIATLALRGLGLAALQRTIYGRTLEAPATSILSELLQPFHLLHAVCWRRIVWRTRRYKVQDDQHFTAIE